MVEPQMPAESAEPKSSSQRVQGDAAQAASNSQGAVAAEVAVAADGLDPGASAESTPHPLRQPTVSVTPSAPHARKAL